MFQFNYSNDKISTYMCLNNNNNNSDYQGIIEQITNIFYLKHVWKK